MIAPSSDQTAPSYEPPPDRPSIEILLATYNSAEYLVPLMESLLAQTVQDFRLVISDDCSRDDTVAILRRYLDSFRHPVTLTIRDTPSGSAMANFAGLMQASDADYVFLCDADDIWYPDKLEKFLDRAKAIHADPSVPLFLFSDAQVIDGAGAVTHPSYWAFKNTDASRCLTLERLLLYGPMLGCASMMNRSLTRLASNVPLGRVAGHDWWIALVAACLGTVDAVYAPTISYRIHGKNASHPREVSVRALSKLTGKLSGMFYEVRRRLDTRQRQAEPLIEQFSNQLAPERLRMIRRFIALRDKSFLRRRFELFWYGHRYPDVLRNAALFLFC